MDGSALWDGPIIDAHQHFWNPLVNNHPWLNPDVNIPFRYGDYSAIKGPYLPPDYLRDSARHNIVQTVYVETEWDPTDPIGETAYACELGKIYGKPNAIVAQAWLDRSDVADVLKAQAGFSLVRSIRHKPGGTDRFAGPASRRTLMSNEKWRKGYALLEQNGLHFDLQSNWWHLDEAKLLARDFPKTTIILNHTGLPTDRSEEGIMAWHAAMAKLAEMPNVNVKISGLGQHGRPWTVEDNGYVINETIAMFGPQRAMFASNFPVDSLCASFDDIYDGFKCIAARYSRGDQSKLFFDTARKVYNIGNADSASGITALDAGTVRCG